MEDKAKMKGPQIDLANLMASGEGESLEFKTSFNIELIETMVAFANTGGGRVI